MPRGPRTASKSDIYHVVERGVGRQIIFEDDTDRQKMLSLLSDKLPANNVALLCWCLMDNHFHLLLSGQIGDIAAALRTSCATYATYFNARHDRAGHLFQGRYKSEPVETDDYLQTVARYIHQNPVKAGIAPTCDYPWSSYREYLGEEGPTQKELVLGLFSGEKDFVDFHTEESPACGCMDVDAVRNKTRAMPEDEAVRLAKGILGTMELGDVKALPRDQRNRTIALLKEKGLSVRQIERLCGVGRNIIQRI